MKEQGEGLAYLVNCFPSLTTTFIYREVQELRRLGMEIRLFSMHKPLKQGLSPESRSFVQETFYLLPAPWPGLILSHAYYLFRRPLTYLGLVITAVFSSGGLQGARRSLLHFGLAGYTARTMERLQIRHIHAHFASNAASVAFFAARLMKGRFSFTAHAFDLFADRVLLKEKTRAAEFVVTISDYNRRFVMELVPEARDKIKVVHCGVDPCEYRPPARSGSSHILEILSVGQLVEKKGFPYLIEALHLLARVDTPFHCTILGDGYQRDLLALLVAGSGLEDRVRIAGAVYQEVTRDCLRVADIFVLPCVVARNGDRDGIPVALMEAMAFGLPVISTTVSGIPELIQHGESGLLVPPRDARALAQALIQMASDERLRKRLSKQGRERIIKDFSSNQSALQLRALFEGRSAVPRGRPPREERRPLPGVDVKGG